ncbi:hypothetical protein M23134_00564 [Microscilla marina ATCC 23134]|uniref:Uncharacterized protein n=1 Tax=Microscilla marina ATCC 23134 TaxID=313606 RepID=A1ZJE4_MICM2|nr:hypothetical protein M23134_00564 [Microscilla marina ATCC 23134]
MPMIMLNISSLYAFFENILFCPYCPGLFCHFYDIVLHLKIINCSFSSTNANSANGKLG